MKKLSLLLLFICLSSQYITAQQVDSSEVQSSIQDTIRKAIPPPLPPPPPPKEEEIFRVVEEMPRFPGCEGKGSIEEIKKCAENELTKFIYTNLRYPQKARDNKIEGMCVVQFTVDKVGEVKDVELVRDIGGGCGEEAVRVIELMNKEGIKWIPTSSRSRPVRVRFTIPVKFKLQ